MLLNRKIVEQDGKCAICDEMFTNCNDIVPDHIEAKGMGGAWRDDHPANVQAVHGLCNLRKGLSDHPKPANENSVRDIDARGGLYSPGTWPMS